MGNGNTHLSHNVFATVCGRPPVVDGIDESTLKRVYEVGEEVVLTCERGYSPSAAASERITCTATGKWTQSSLACSRELLRRRC